MISSVPEDPEGTQHVDDGPAPSTETQFVPDGTVLGPAVSKGNVSKSGVVKAPLSQPSPWARPMGSRPPQETQHVADLPRFGRFRALAQLGYGTMGTVYRAKDDVLGRSVAIKALTSGNTDVRERFLREARAIGAVLHPNILAVYDAGTDDDTPYLVMELAGGGSLRERIREGALPIETVRELGIQISRALAAAHAANIIHRDVKPANILLAGETWKLADFGIARLPDSTLTIEGQFVGSPSYAAPESLRAGTFSPASDVYGLGATLYEALTGAPPHGDHDMTSVVRKLEQDAPPVNARRPVPSALDHAITATLSRDPSKRPTAEQLAHLLANTSDDEPIVAPARTSPSMRTKVLALALAAIAIGFVAFAVSRNTGTSSAPALEPSLKPAQKVPAVPSESEEPLQPKQPQPRVVDPWGNPVDDETARKILEDMERDAREQVEGPGRKRGKKRKR